MKRSWRFVEPGMQVGGAIGDGDQQEEGSDGTGGRIRAQKRSEERRDERCVHLRERSRCAMSARDVAGGDGHGVQPGMRRSVEEWCRRERHATVGMQAQVRLRPR